MAFWQKKQDFPTHVGVNRPLTNCRMSVICFTCTREGEPGASGQTLRSAVEAMVRSIKHLFGKGKAPVREQTRVSMVVIGSAVMNNARRIHVTKLSKESSGNGKREQEMDNNRLPIPFLPFLLDCWLH